MISGVTLEVPEFAERWARELGCSKESLVKLDGGINNQVYRCGDQHHWIIKGYRALADASTDRMQAEAEFLKYSNEVAQMYVPRIIHVDTSLRCIIQEYLIGKPFKAGSKISAQTIEEATRFFRLINSDYGLARQTIHSSAAEGCLTLFEHLSAVENRIKLMKTEHLGSSLRDCCLRLRDRVNKEYTLTNMLCRKLVSNGYFENVLNQKHICVSPSDFGFHNAIQTTDGVKFFDFEFSGWDDPAKASVDFILQPRIRVKENVSPLLDGLSNEQRCYTEQRSKILLPILSLKWVCIILSVLNPTRYNEVLAHIPESSVHEFIHERFAKAASYLNEVNHRRQLISSHF